MEHQACPVVGGSHDPAHLRDRRSPGSLKRACLQCFAGACRLIGSRFLETFGRFGWDGHETAP